MQNRDNLGDEYNLYDLSIEDSIINLDEVFSVYKYVYTNPETAKFGLKKLISASLNKITKLNKESTNIKSLFTNTLSLLTNIRGLSQSFPSPQQLAKIHQEAVNISLKFQEIINAISLEQNIIVNKRAQTLLHLMPALDVFMHMMQKVPQLVSQIDPSYASSFIQVLKDLDSIGESLIKNYDLLQQQRLKPQDKKHFWVEVWDLIHYTLYANNCCAPLEEVKSLSRYWHFLLDDLHTVRVVKASMPKFAHLTDEPEELSKQAYQNTISPEIEFKQLTNHVVFNTENDLELLEQKKINAYIARDNSPKKLIEILAKLLLDSDLDLINSRIGANREALRETRDALQKIATSSEDINIQILKSAMQAKHEISSACLDNLIKILSSQSLTNLNLLIIEAIKLNCAKWVGIYLKYHASIHATDHAFDDVLLISLKAHPRTRSKVLDKILTLSEEQLLEIPSLRSDTVAKFVDQSTGNTLLHEIALLKKPAYTFFKFYCQLDLNCPDSYIFFVRNNQLNRLTDLITDIKLKNLIQQHQKQLFHQALSSVNPLIVNLYLKNDGDVNAILHGQHPLAIVWKNLKDKDEDEDVIDILFALLQSGIDVNTPVHNCLSIYDATCQTISARSIRHRFLTDTQNNYKEALRVLTDFRRKNLQRKLLENLKDELILNWLTCNTQLNIQELNQMCASMFIYQLFFQGETNKTCLLIICLVISVSVIHHMLPNTPIIQKKPDNGLETTETEISKSTIV